MEPTKGQWYQRRIAELEAQVRQRDQRIAALECQNARLAAQVARLTEQVAKLSKNSSNSSKPPSSDMVKPPKSTSCRQGNSRKRKRKIGGQPGHPKHERPFFRQALLDVVFPGGVVHALQDRSLARFECADCDAGRGVQWRSGLRLLLGLSQVHARVQRRSAVLSGSPDS